MALYSEVAGEEPAVAQLHEGTALVGVSLGGRVALEVALARPELVSALVLVAPGPPGHEWSEALRALWGEEDAERLAREIPGARLATIAATAHVPSTERPRGFDELVLPLLAEAA